MDSVGGARVEFLAQALKPIERGHPPCPRVDVHLDVAGEGRA